MGAVHRLACGECVQAGPTGALMPATLVDANNVRTKYPDKQADLVCRYRGVGCQLTYNIKDDKPLDVTGGRAGERESLSAKAVRLRLCAQSQRLTAADDP